MGTIIYRHYKSGDDQQLANLFNITFQQGGGGFIRTPKSWVWRYVQSPGFEPEMCQIAEDIDKKIIVGAVYANLIEKIPLGSSEYLVGEINDVSCHPKYARKGIATNLMKMAIEYMQKKGCDLSLLSTGYNDFAQKKLYKKLSYVDVDKEIIFIQFPNILRLIRDIYAFAFLFPAFFIYSYIPRFINRIKMKFYPSFKDFAFEINHNKKHFGYMKAVNNILPKYYTGFPKYNKTKLLWSRVKVPAIRHKPTYVIIRKKGIIIGGATISHQNFYIFKYGIKIRIGLIHEIFLDKDQFNNKTDLNLGYIYLIDIILKAATQRSLGVIIYKSASKDHDLHRGFKSMNFLKFQDDVLMMKVLKENTNQPKLKKPIFISPCVSIGVP
jgi:ribosomal protein S18 acetylase RimI-like enzyme